nr:Chain B, PROTEIN (MITOCHONDRIAL ALDEHYDE DEHYDROGENASE) [synthetic construct]
GPRLSRLLSYA